jgi:iron complex outermembrane receptor protein
VQNPTIKVPAFGTFAQIDGQPLPNAPKYNLNFTAATTCRSAPTARCSSATDWNVQGYTNFVLYKTKEFYSKGNFEGGAEARLREPGPRL